MNCKCTVKGCKNKVKFKFPKEEIKRRNWLHAIERPHYRVRDKDGLCGDHFLPEQIATESIDGGFQLTKPRLNKDAVPCTFRGQNSNPVSSKKIKKSDTIQSSMQQHIIEVQMTKQVQQDMIEVEMIKPEILEAESMQQDMIEIEMIKPEMPPIETIYITEENYITNSEICNYSNDILPSNINVLSKTNVPSNIVVPFNIVVPSNKPQKENDVNDKIRKRLCYVENIVKNILNEHDYHISNVKDYQSSQPNVLCRYSIDQFQNDAAGLFYFTGIDNYKKKFKSVFQSLGRKVFEIKYHYDESKEQEISAENKLFLTLWKLRRNCEDYELSRHFCISEIAMKVIFKKMVIFMANHWSSLDIWPSAEFMKPYMPKGCDTVTTSKALDTSIKKKHILLRLKAEIDKNISVYKILSKPLDPTYMPLASEITGVCITLCNFNEIIKT